MSGNSTTLNQAGIDAAIADAATRGFEIVRGDDKTILLDLDSDDAYTQYERVMPVLREHVAVKQVDEWASKGGGMHVRITIDGGLSVEERLGIEAALGGDGMRAMLAYVRLWNDVSEPSVLFRPDAPPAN